MDPFRRCAVFSKRLQSALGPWRYGDGEETSTSQDLAEEAQVAQKS
jgi:hypothetical protein